MLRSKRQKIPDYKLNQDRSRTAYQACRLHDQLMDGLKAFNSLPLDIGCRSTNSPVASGVRQMAEFFKDDDPREKLPIVGWIKNCLAVQDNRPDNLLNEAVLDKMEEMYCAFAENRALEMIQTDQYGGAHPQLMVRPLVPINTSTTQPGLEFICFPIPEPEDILEDIHFTEDYCFTSDSGRGYIQLGPATLLNHHCDPRAQNVKQFGNIRGRRPPIKGLDIKFFQPSMTRNIQPGEELCIDYGHHFFGDNNCDCHCSKHVAEQSTDQRTTRRIIVRPSTGTTRSAGQEASRVRSSTSPAEGTARKKRKRESAGEGAKNRPKPDPLSTPLSRASDDGDNLDTDLPSTLPDWRVLLQPSDDEDDGANHEGQGAGSSAPQEQQAGTSDDAAESSTFASNRGGPSMVPSSTAQSVAAPGETSTQSLDEVSVSQRQPPIPLSTVDPVTTSAPDRIAKGSLLEVDPEDTSIYRASPDSVQPQAFHDLLEQLPQHFQSKQPPVDDDDDDGTASDKEYFFLYSERKPRNLPF